MARNLTVSGLDLLFDQLRAAEAKCQDVAAKGVYVGAGIIADEVRRQINSIQTAQHGVSIGDVRLPTDAEKAILQQEHVMGIVPFTKNGADVSTVIGIRQDSGYAYIGKRRVPVPLIARSIEHGTSFMRKTPFFRTAVNRSKKEAKQATTQYIERSLQDILK